MATTEYGVNHPLSNKLWSKKLAVEALKQTYASRFMGASSSSLIQIKDETNKAAGDRITVGLRMQLTGSGVLGDATLEGNEEALTTYHDNVLINQLRHAVRSDGKMSEQRVPFSVREEAMAGLVDWQADRLDTAFFNHICGNTSASSTNQGQNAPTAPSTNRIFYMNGLSTEAQIASASASNKFTIGLIDYAIERAKTVSPLIRPVMVNGKAKYVMFLHPYQVTDLRTNTSSGQWLDITKAVYQGSKTENPIYDGALGEYNGVILHESTRVASVTANVYRSVLCGAQACAIAWGRDGGPTQMQWKEELFDYENQLGVKAGGIWGLKKMVFNSEDFGTIVVPTYAALHT